MKRTLLTVMVAAGFCASIAAAAPGGVGLGFIAGEPTGLSAKVWTTDRTAIDAALAWSVYRYAAMHVHADFLWHTANLIESENGFLPLYIGVGGRVKLSSGDNELRAGVRVPFGAEYVFPSVPVGLFLELVPIFDLTPSTGFNWNSAVGIRYYFGSHSD